MLYTGAVGLGFKFASHVSRHCFPQHIRRAIVVRARLPRIVCRIFSVVCAPTVIRRFAVSQRLSLPAATVAGRRAARQAAA